MSDFTRWLEKGRADGRGAMLGLWQSLASPYSAEICAQSGFDWLLFDGEHAPNTVQTLLAQLQAVSPYPIHAIARTPDSGAVPIKHYLDIGFRTLLVPMVESPGQAEVVVAAARFPPMGTRGVASATSRASGFGRDARYLTEANDRTGIVVQIESRKALESVGQIASIDGVDGLFIGPADLAASLGHLGNPRHADVQNAIDMAFASIKAAGKPAGIFALDANDAQSRMEQGFSFVSIGTDIGLLGNGSRRLLASLKR